MKLTSFLLVAVSALLLTNCNLLKPKTTTTETSVDKTTIENAGNPGIISSIKDAITAGQAMECTYDEGGNPVTTLVQGKQMKVEGYSYTDLGGNPTKGWMVNDGTWMYIWGEGEQKGMKYNVTQMQEISQDLTEDSESEDWQSPEKWAEDIDAKQDVNCKPTRASDADFTPPVDVEFQDLSAMMQGVGEVAKKFMDSDAAKDLKNINPDDMEAQLENLKNMIPESEDPSSDN